VYVLPDSVNHSRIACAMLGDGVKLVKQRFRQRAAQYFRCFAIFLHKRLSAPALDDSFCDGIGGHGAFGCPLLCCAMQCFLIIYHVLDGKSIVILYSYS
jgi:hypothetical protein